MDLCEQEDENVRKIFYLPYVLDHHIFDRVLDSFLSCRSCVPNCIAYNKVPEALTSTVVATNMLLVALPVTCSSRGAWLCHPGVPATATSRLGMSRSSVVATQTRDS